MDNRLAMNSSSLQEYFPEIYKDFFSRCPLVVSTPGSFIWSGEYASIFGGFSVNQTLPLRLYVGLEPRSTGEIGSGSYCFFSPASRQWENRQYDQITRAKILQLVEKEISKITNKEKNNGFILHILSEVPAERGLNASGAMSAALATAIYLFYSGGFSATEIRKWPQRQLSELSADQYFERIFRLAWKIESIFHAGASSGRGALIPLIDSFYPIIYFLTDQSNQSSTAKRKNVFSYFEPLSSQERYEIIDTTSYQAFRLDELFDLPIHSYYWPIDFGLIYSGYENSTASIIKMLPNIQADLKETLVKIREQLKKKRVHFNQADHFRKSQDPWQTIIGSLGIISLKIASAFEDLIKRGHSEEHLQELFKSINQYQNVLHILEASTTSIDHICFSVYEKSRKLDIVSGAGAKLVGAGHGGDVLFTAPIGIFRKSIEELVEELKKSYNKEITLDYASWLDGYGQQGVRVEQNLEEKTYSSFVSQGASKVLHLNIEGLLHSDLYTLEEFDRLKNKADLLFDAINGEIYIKGQRLTSKEIHSATTTIEIIQVLLANLGKNVKNSQLPPSSYTADRNELQSKIIGPLARAILKKTKRRLPIFISGGVVDFFVCWEENGLEIYLLEKIF